MVDYPEPEKGPESPPEPSEGQSTVTPNHWGAFRIRHPKKRAFLTKFSQTGSVTVSADAAHMPRCQHYTWLETDPDYVRAFADAQDRYTEQLETEADRRAVEGTLKPVFWQGHQVGSVREFSDVLLIFRLKGLRPNTYRDNVRQETVMRARVEVGHVNLSQLTDEELHALHTLAEKSAGPSTTD
jgi:hypothetical protein